MNESLNYTVSPSCSSPPSSPLISFPPIRSGFFFSFGHEFLISLFQVSGQTETLQSTDQTCWNTHSDVTYTDAVLRLAPITSHKLSKKWKKTQGELPEGYCPRIPHLLVREMDVAEPSLQLFSCSAGAWVTETRHICVHAVSSSLFVSWHKCIRASMHSAAKMNTHTPLTVNKVMTKMTAICLLVSRSHWPSLQLIHKTSTLIIKKKD